MAKFVNTLPHLQRRLRGRSKVALHGVNDMYHQLEQKPLFGQKLEKETIKTSFM